jgi:hypothetical protein
MIRFLILLAIILAVLFWRSFMPDQILFNNDGPIGVVRHDIEPYLYHPLIIAGNIMVLIWFLLMVFALSKKTTPKK